MEIRDFSWLCDDDKKLIGDSWERANCILVINGNYSILYIREGLDSYVQRARNMLNNQYKFNKEFFGETTIEVCPLEAKYMANIILENGKIIKSRFEDCR